LTASKIVEREPLMATHSQKTLIAIAATIVTALFGMSYAFSQNYPIRVNSGGRFLEDQDGNPFFINGNAAWSLSNELTYAQADQFMQNMKAKGITTLLWNTPEAYFTGGPANKNGDEPFGATDFVNMNEDYWKHIDSLVNRAEELGLNLLMSPVYLGYNCGAEGWCSSVKARSDAQMKAYGVWIGNRYKNNKNIMWCMGGDTNPSSVASKLNSVVSGINEADVLYGPRLYTIHNERNTRADSHINPSWLSLNNIYTDATVVSDADNAYSRNPTLPFFLIEAIYENEGGSTPQSLRAQAYWTILRGGCGHIFGNRPMWYFGSGWQNAMESSGHVSMMHFGNLFRSRHWWKLVPDRNGKVITSGAQTGSSLATFAYASDSTSIIGYLPSQRTVTIDPGVLEGDSIQVWWYQPSNGSSTNGGILSNTSRSYTPPSGGDWVLVIDGFGFGFGPPTVTDVSDPSLIPEKFTLSQNYPNPFNPTTTISYELPLKATVVLDVFDSVGRKVRRLTEGVQAAGRYALQWDGKDSSGHNVSSGIYLYQLRTEKGQITKKMVLIK
jgi:hypothetical protein